MGGSLNLGPPINLWLCSLRLLNIPFFPWRQYRIALLSFSHPWSRNTTLSIGLRFWKRIWKSINKEKYFLKSLTGYICAALQGNIGVSLRPLLYILQYEILLKSAWAIINLLWNVQILYHAPTGRRIIISSGYFICSS